MGLGALCGMGVSPKAHTSTVMGAWAQPAGLGVVGLSGGLRVPHRPGRPYQRPHLPAGHSRQRAPPRTALGRWGPRLRHPEPQPRRRRCKPARPRGPVAGASRSRPAVALPSLGSPRGRARGGGAPGAGGAGGGRASRPRPLMGAARLAAWDTAPARRKPWALSVSSCVFPDWRPCLGLQGQGSWDRCAQGVQKSWRLGLT